MFLHDFLSLYQDVLYWLKNSYFSFFLQLLCDICACFIKWVRTFYITNR